MFNWATAFAAKYSTAPAFAVTPTAVFFTPPASSDATLSALSLSQGRLSPSFVSGTLAYTASVAHSVSSLIVTPNNDANATATVNGASTATPVTLAVGRNTVTVHVTAQDGTTTQNYTVTVTRVAALTVALTGPSGTVTGPFTVTATLSSPVVSFVASDVTVVNGQVTGVTGSGTSYAIAVTPVLGQQVSVSVAAGVVSTALGTSNQLSNILQVQAGSPATAFAATYGTVPGFGATSTAAFFTPPASSDATLSALTLSSGSFSPGFASGTLAYTASVDNSVSSLIVTPTTNDANATSTVNGASPATPVSLALGSNTVTVQVTAQDGVTT